MTARVICFVSAKGGTGKTVVSASFAQFIGALNKKVLLVDTDASTNGLTLFYLHRVLESRIDIAKKTMTAVGMFEADQDRLPTPFILNEHVDMIPATYVMEQTADCDVERFRRVMKGTVTKFSKNYDYIFLDAQAGSDIYAEIPISVADEAIIVSEYDPVSFAGVDRLKTIFAKIMPYEKRWILYNKVLPEFAKKVGGTRVLERYLPPIPWDVEVVRAFAERKLALDTEAGSEHTLAIMRTVSSLLGERIRKEIEKWKQQKSDEIREPILIQKTEIEKEIVALKKSLIGNEYKLQDLKRRPTKFAIYAAIAIAIAVGYMLMLTYFLDLRFPSDVLFAAVISFCSILLVAYYQLLERLTRRRVIDRQVEVEKLKAELDELMETYRKKKALIESDIDRLLEHLE